MAQVLRAPPRKKTFGEEISENISSGMTRGFDQASNFAQKMALEEARQGLLGKKALASNPYRPSGKELISEEEITSSPRGTQEEVSFDYENSPILNPQQIMQEGNKLAYERTQAGSPTSAEQGQELVRQRNADIGQYRNLQRDYGNIAEQTLTNVLPTATDEHKALFNRKGEGYAREGLSESAVKRKLAVDAKNLKNAMSQVKNSLPSNRLSSAFKEFTTGQSPATDKSVRNKLKPLLDEGLYDTARDLLSQSGLHAEERENLISSLGETPKKILSQLPSFKTEKERRGLAVATKPLSYEQMGMAKEGIENILKQDPSVNLVLLRKAAEDKGIDWKVFKDSIDDAMFSGKWEPSDDQFKFLDTLDQPPLAKLDRILHGLKLIGR